LIKIKQMDKTIEILEKSVKYAKKQLIENWDKIESEQTLAIKRGLKETMNFIEVLKEINNQL
jgi:hypothetical protein